ncbi:MAG: DNA mismatch repair protein MutS [Treponema sp.]|nr:DNA mismatch repair protein MutS [Treponema sp.]
MVRSHDTIVAGVSRKSSPASEVSPLMQQYLSIKAQHQDEILFFRLGDFYEMFGDEAVEVSRLLNLTLTHRQNDSMCGIPYHAAKIYIARLLRLGKKIAVCEQVGEIAKGKGLTERKVVEVITPGTAIESEYLEGGTNNFLASLFVKGGMAGFAYIDVTTSDFFATSWSLSEMSTQFPKELGRAHPRELLLPEALRSDSTVQGALSQLPAMSVSYYPDWNFDIALSYKRLVEQFKTVNLRSFSLTELSPEVCPAGFLLDYLKKTAVTTAPHVSSIKVYRDCDYVVMDDSSRRNLEILENLRDGTSQYTLYDCVSHTQTAMGKRMLRLWLLYPLTDSEKIEKRQNHIALFMQNRRLLDDVHEKLSSVLDIERLAGRVAMERAHAKDLQALRASLEMWISARDSLDTYDFSQLSLDEARAVISLISSAILDDPATSLTEGRIIRPGWSSELDHWRDVQENFTKILEEYTEEEKQKTGIANLRVKYNGNSGYYIEVTKGKLSQVPEHFIMRRSLLNAERYTTARLQELERELNEAGSRIVELERDLFLEVRRKIADSVPYLLQTSREIAYADVSSALAYAAILHHWVRPLVDNSGVFKVTAGRHPVVEMHLPDGEFVPNDVELSASGTESGPRFSLITGPNMAGKSTYLRQTALITLLAQIGSCVPADSAHIGVVDRIFCRVGASDNLAKGESTFLVEMTETANILRSATTHSLVIMDEVGRGTSTEDGLSIAWAVSEYLLNTVMCKTLFATHYHELTRMEHPALVLQCMAVSENAGSVVFLRKIKQGASENSYGIHVARLAGVPDTVIRRAGEILDRLQRIASDKPVLGSGDMMPETVTVSQETQARPSASAPGLFSDEELVLDEILSCSPDDMTPMQALQLVARWKKALSGR